MVITSLVSALTLSSYAAQGRTQNAPRTEVAGIPVNYDEALVGTYTLSGPLLPTIYPTWLVPGGEHDSKPRPSAHHALVGFRRTLQREDFIHRPHATEHTEGESVLRIDRRP